MSILISRKGGGAGGGGAPSGPAGGVLSGTYPNPGFAQDPPGTELAYAQNTNNVSVTGVNAAGANTLVSGASIGLDGSTEIRVEVYAPYVQTGTTSDSAINFSVWDGSTDLGLVGVVGVGDGTRGALGTVHAALYLTPSAGNHQYIFKAYRDVANGNVFSVAAGGILPIFIRVTVA